MATKTKKRVMVIGTRGSLLARAQSGQILKALTKLWPKALFKLVTIQTYGDEYQTVDIFKKSGVGVFTKAIEKKLYDGSIDIAVHSLKDLPTQLANGLKIGAIPKREKTQDVLLSKKRWSFSQFPSGSKIGTGSLRRMCQLRLVRPDLKIVNLRGNLDTRVKKVLQSGVLDAVIVAKAGIERIQKYKTNCFDLDKNKFMPAVGQGALAIQIRENDFEVERLVRILNDAKTQKICDAERSFLKTLHGGCRVPIGILGSYKKNNLQLRACVYSVNSDKYLQATASGTHSVQVGEALAKKLLKMGAAKLLLEAREDKS